MWPRDAESLRLAQLELARARPQPWVSGGRVGGAGGPGGADGADGADGPGRAGLRIGACWACAPRGLTGPGGAGDTVWAAAVVLQDGRVVDQVVRHEVAGAPYEPGRLALRLGPVLESAVAALDVPPDVLMVDATGRDHPRRAGFALHLGSALDVPTVGVTHRPLVAEGEWPGEERGDSSDLRIGSEVVACWLRARPSVRPLVVHAGWRVELRQAVELVTATTTRWRTPEPLRRARHLARRARD